MAWREVPVSLVVRQMAQPLHVASALVAALLSAGQEDVALDLYCIYRRRNVAILHRLIDSVPIARARLWSLDQVDAQLSDSTVGVGPGTRTELLNQLSYSEEGTDRWLLITDDDVRLPRGQLRRFLRLAVQAALDVSQPAHLPRSYANWKFNRQRLIPLVRSTRFVEQGPMVLLSPKARRACLPFPEELGMGWGLEAHFATAADASLRLGIVDAVGMRHLSPVADSYDRETSDETGRKALDQAGFAYYADMQVVVATWPFWRRRPPWNPGGGSFAAGSLNFPS
jgi:hypothetical protein